MNLQTPTSLEILKPRRAAGWLVVLALAAGLLANAQSTDNSSTTDFSSFQVIVQRNIFDPNRYPRESRNRPRDEGAPTFTLAGTMSYRKGMFAFFSGTSDEYQKAIQNGGAIGNYTVTNINFDGCELIGAGKAIDMKVGASMRQAGGGWELVEPLVWGASSGTAVDSAGESNNTSQTSSLPSSMEQNDVLKRLMEKREQELK